MTLPKTTLSSRTEDPKFRFDTKEDAEWIEGESIRAFMPTQQQTQVIALFVIPIVFAILYGYVNMLGLVVWAIVSVCLTIYRWQLTADYTKRLSEASTSVQIQFKREYFWT